MISMYDLEDNLITVFDTYKEAAEYFNTSVGVIRCYICRSRQGKINKKRNGNNWCRLFKMEKE